MKKILLFNFYNGVLYRGIPIYSSNLKIGLEKEGCEVNEWKCPNALNKMPRFLLDLLFVFSEQILMPLICFFGRYDKVIYPYNSCSILSAIVGKSLLIIHDFIPNKKNKSKLSLSALYIVLTQRVHTLLKRDVAFVSRTTQRIGKNVSWLKKCGVYLFPNSFYILERELANLKCKSFQKDEYAVLISGNGTNKEFTKAMELWKGCNICYSHHLKVIGLGGHQEWAQKILKSLNINNVSILPVLSDSALLCEIINASFVWAHSNHEGFGRPVIEGRMCGKNVLATNISAFREHKDDNVFLYNQNSFCENLRLAHSFGCKPNYKIKYHLILEEQIKKWLMKN